MDQIVSPDRAWSIDGLRQADGRPARWIDVTCAHPMDRDADPIIFVFTSRVRGIDAILGRHTHDATPRPVIVDSPTGKTLVMNGG